MASRSEGGTRRAVEEEIEMVIENLIYSRKLT
jgi:hypothetical protein